MSTSQRREAAAVESLRVFESAFRLEWMADPWDDVDRAGQWLLGLEDHLRPDVVHLNGYAHAALPWRAPTLVVAHSCVLSWWEAVHGGCPPETWDRYGRAVREGLAAADAVVAPTRAMLEALRRHYGALPAARVIANGRGAERFPPAAKEPIVLSAGRLWDEAKNLSTLDRAAQALSWPVYVAGEETRPDGGTARARWARPLGRLDPRALAEWLGRAALYASPARYEPFGLSVLEAALAGSALVLGDIPSLREVWGDAAAWVAPADAEGLRSALEDLIGDGPARDELARRARRRALELTPERMAAGYLEAYGALQARRRDREVAACAS